jgi:hypothetical protein
MTTPGRVSRSALAAAVIGLVAAVGGLVAAAPAAVAAQGPAAVAEHGSPHDGGPTGPGTAATTGTAERGDTLGLVAGGSALLIVATIAGGAWRSRRDPATAARGH